MLTCSFQRRHLAIHLSNNNVRGNRAENVNLFDRRRDERFTKHRAYPLLALEATIESREEFNSSYEGGGTGIYRWF